MKDRATRLISLAFVGALLYAGHGLHRLAGGEPIEPRADGQVIGPAMTVDAEDVLVTSSADGKTLYIWAFGPWDLNERRVPQLRRVVCAP